MTETRGLRVSFLRLPGLDFRPPERIMEAENENGEEKPCWNRTDSGRR